MDLRAESFLDRAVDAGLLSMIHRTIVQEMADQSATIDDIVQLIVNFNVCDEMAALQALRDKVAALPEPDLLNPETEIKAAKPAVNPAMPAGRQAQSEKDIEKAKKTASENLGLDWFCYLAISQGCVSKETALGLMSEVADIADILDFAQAIIDHWLSDDFSKVQALVDQAFTLTSKGAVPPYSIFLESRGIVGT